jgi:tripartite-type tricarboxylate transporter receptor subunit TctC
VPVHARAKRGDAFQGNGNDARALRSALDCSNCARRDRAGPLLQCAGHSPHRGVLGAPAYSEEESMVLGKLLCACALAATANIAWAQTDSTYPNRPIRLIVPYPPGASTNDILGRALAQRLGPVLGQQVVVENRSGASGTLGSEVAAKSAPDGYTLLVAVASPLAVGPAVYPKLGFHPVRDFAPIARIATIPYIMAVHPSLPVANAQELIALAKRRPGQINFASSGNGGTPHLCSELFKTVTGTDMTHIPYKGAGIAMVDLVGGQVQMFCTGATAFTGQIKAGRVKPIGVATLERLPQFPDIPTFHEQGVKGFEVNSWTGVVAPAKTPPEIIRKLYDAVAQVMKTDDMRSFMAGQGADVALLGPQEFGRYIEQEMVKWGKVARAAKLTASN